MLREESFLNSLQIQSLQQRRKKLEVGEQQRHQDLEQNIQLAENKLQKELEFLIKDRHLIEKRNNAIIDELNRIKQKTMSNLSKIQTTNENLVKCKQEIYDHLIRYHPRQAQEFKKITILQQPNYQQQIIQFEAKAAQFQEKETELNYLMNENQKLKQELQLQQQQQQYINQFQSSPFIPQDMLFRASNMGLKDQTMIQKDTSNIQKDTSKKTSTEYDFPNTSYSLEQRVMQQYVGRTQSDIEQYDESIKRKSQPSFQERPYGESMDQDYLDFQIK